MAEPTEFPQSNMEWHGEGDVGPLSVCHDETNGENISRWYLTMEERLEILETGVVWLHVWGPHPGVYVSGHNPFESPFEWAPEEPDARPVE